MREKTLSKRTTLLTGVAAALVLVTAGCGGLSDDEKTAAKSIASSLEGPSPSAAQKKAITCLSEKLVTEAGVDQLQKDKLLDEKLKVEKQGPKKLSKKSGQAYGTAYVACYDPAKFKADIKKSSGATTKQVDAYVACVKKIDDGDMKAAITAQVTRSTSSKALKKVSAATAKCDAGLKKS